MMSRKGSSEGISSLVLLREAKQIGAVKEDLWRATWNCNMFSLAFSTPESKGKFQRQLRCAEILPKCLLDNFAELMT